jgi:hypothetical protein
MAPHASVHPDSEPWGAASIVGALTLLVRKTRLVEAPLAQGRRPVRCCPACERSWIERPPRSAPLGQGYAGDVDDRPRIGWQHHARMCLRGSAWGSHRRRRDRHRPVDGANLPKVVSGAFLVGNVETRVPENFDQFICVLEAQKKMPCQEAHDLQPLRR